jgi:hypothetical protein
MNRITKSTTWRDLGSCEVLGSVCEWLVHLAIRSERTGLWSIRWQGEEDHEEIIGPDHLDSLAQFLIEERGIDRDELLNLFEFSGIRAVEEFAGMNRSS